MEISEPLPRLNVVHQIILAADSCGTPNIWAKAECLKMKLRESVSGPQSANAISWSRVLSQKQLSAVRSFCDLIIPADEYGPAASAVHVHEFIDEWISTPSPDQELELEKFVTAFKKLDGISNQNHGQEFASLVPANQRQVLDQIIKERKSTYRSTYEFFVYFRKLAGVAYFTTSLGQEAIGYVGGNIAPSVFTGPPAEVLKELGFTDADCRS